MTMEKFKYLYSFKYNNKDYIYLYSRNYPFYFLEYDFNTNKFEYPDIDTFKDLYNKFNSNDKLYFKYDLKKLKQVLLDLNLDITPLVKTTSGLLSLALVFSMCGCTQTNDIKDKEVVESTAIVEKYDKSQEIYNYFKSYNIDVTDREYDGNDYIFVNEFINSSGKKEITLHSFDEFRKFNNLDFIPTWDDVIEAFQDNENIDIEKKNIILDGINNLRSSEELKDIDLSVLYVNAKEMKIKYVSSNEMINTTNRNSVYAYFDVASKTVYLPSDRPLEKFEFIHEVLGHGTLAFREETADSLVVFDCTNYLMLPTDNRYSGHSMGIMVSEGGANMIAHFATNDYSVSTFYELYEEELRVVADLCNVSIGELFNHKGISLYDLMYKNGIDTPVEYIFKMDGIIKGQLYCEFSYLMERLCVDATEEEFIQASKKEQDEIIKTTVEIIKDSYFKDREGFNFPYDGGSISYSFDVSANNYEENMNKLR